MSLIRALATRITGLLALLMLNGCGFGSEASQSQNAKLAGPAAVLFNIEGSMPQFQNQAGLFPSLENSQYKIEHLFAKAASDLQVMEVVIHWGALNLSFARAQELVAAIGRISARGKPVTCHIDEADNLTYWIVAKACPRILVSPAGGMDALGLSMEAIYVRELLASLGVTADMLSIGKYKDAAESLTRDGMSPESREAAKSLLFELHRLFTADIATGRKIAVADVQKLIDSSPYDAKETVKLGLADEVSTLAAYMDSIRSKYAAGVIDEYGKSEPKPFSFTDLMKLFAGGDEKAKPATDPRIALVPVIGPIMSGTSDGLLSGMDTVRDTALVEGLSELARDETVKAVVLRIDSPGGSALASDNIWHAVRALAEKKTVVASLGDVAASGGYYIASAATEILSSPSSITGSIGVVGGKIVLGEAAAKFGIKTERIQTGTRASLSSPFSPFDEDGREAIKGLMQKTYDLFVDRVVEGRGLDRAKVLEVAEGRVWTGSQATKIGLVDKAGTLYDAIERARTLASLPPGTKVEILPKPKSVMDKLGEALADPQASTMVAISRRHAGVRRVLCLIELLLDRRVATFTPTLFEIR